MASSPLFSRVKVATATTGTGTITLGAAQTSFLTFAGGGVANGNQVSYLIEDGTAWEIGTGTYTASGTTLSRTVILSSNANAAINLSGTAVVSLTALPTDIVTLDGTQTLTAKTLTSPAISGGTVNNASVGATTASTGAFTTLTATAGTLDNISVGATTRSTGAFTTLTANSNATFTGGEGTFGIGAVNSSASLNLNNTTVAVDSKAVRIAQTIGATTTNSHTGVIVSLSTAPSAFTIQQIIGFNSGFATKGAGSAIVNVFGYFADNGIGTAAATSNMSGFYSNITAVTNAWNFYAAGTANNAFAGNTRFGGVTAPTVAVDVTGSLSVSGAIVGRINPRITNVASSATPTPDVSTTDQYNITALAAAAAFAVPAGTPLDGQKLIIRVKDNGTARALTYNAIYRAVGVTLPTTTVISKTTYLGLIYNVVIPSWDVVAVATEV
jgi:hypothetical protein